MTGDALADLAAADAHLGRPVPLPRSPLPLVRWSQARAAGAGGVEIELNLDDSRPGTPGRLALYVGAAPPPDRDWPGGEPSRPVPVGGGPGRWREAALAEAQPSLRPVVELAWSAHGLHLRLTAQGPWPPARLIEIAESIVAG